MALVIDNPADRPGSLSECPDCGLFQTVAHLRPGQMAQCERCDALLQKRRRHGLRNGFALASTALVILLVAAVSPMMGFRLAGQERVTSLLHLPVAFEDQGMPPLAIIVLATTLAAPLIRLSLTVGLLGGLRWLSRTTLVQMARLREILTPWAMVEVFLLGLFVAYTRLAARATVEVELGLWALGALVVVNAAAEACVDEHALWTMIGRRGRAAKVAPGASAGGLMGCDCCRLVSRGRPGLGCPRCDTPLRVRKPQAITRTWALLITAAVLYVPANLLPILTLTNLGRGPPSTIMGGVQELIEYRMWPLAALVFVASILVPVLKLLGLGLLLILTQRRSGRCLVDRTRLFRIVDFVGRWSMIDVFMLSVLTALVRMGALASVTPGYGAVAFAFVVVLTMLAALSFDPRLMWDAAEEQAGAPARGAGPAGVDEGAIRA